MRILDNETQEQYEERMHLNGEERRRAEIANPKYPSKWDYFCEDYWWVFPVAFTVIGIGVINFIRG